MDFVLVEVVKSFYSNYHPTPRQALIDSFLLFCAFTALAQLAYAVHVGSFPFNSFLSGFLSAVSTFVFTGFVSFDLFTF